MLHVIALLLALADCGLSSGWTLQLEKRIDPLQVLVRITNGSTSGAYLPTADDCYPTIVVKRAGTEELITDLNAAGRCDVYHVFPGYYLAPGATTTKTLSLNLTSPGSYLVTARDLIVSTESVGGCFAQLKIESAPITITVTADDLAKEKGTRRRVP